jgi:GNAT superfamily N-acetyltransferase
MLAIREIHSKAELKKFIAFAWDVYRDDPNWVPPLIGDTLSLLDKKKSPFFEFGEAGYFMAFRDNKPVGRITAHINHRHNDAHQVKEGFFGFYECLPDAEAAQALFKAAEDWVKTRGMHKIIGQENFTIYDELGFMIKGWDATPSTPVIMETYTPKYYLEQLSQAGYEKEIDWIAFLVKSDFKLKETLYKIKERLLKRSGLTLRRFNLKKIDEEVAKVKVIFNEGWKENWGHYPLTDKQFAHIAAGLKVLVDERVCYIVEKDGQAVGCSISLPDLNPAVQKMNGRLFPFGIFHLLAGKKKATGLRTFMMGVLKEHRNLGIDILMVLETFLEGTKAGYTWSECSLIVETNQRMINAIERWGGEPYKVYRLFSKKL